MNYFEHNDTRGRDQRLEIAAWNDARARMHATLAEYDHGTVTLWMSKLGIRAALAAARRLHAGGVS